MRPRWGDVYNVQLNLKFKVEGWTEDVSNNERIQDDLNNIPHTKLSTVQDRSRPNDNAKKEKGKQNKCHAKKRRSEKSQLGKYCISQEGKLVGTNNCR